MENKIVWVGGIHGVGKTSSLKLVSTKNPSLRYLYLGELFFKTARDLGMRWEELVNRVNLLEVEYKVKEALEKKILESNLLIDGHFAIHLGNLTYPGFHSHNLRSLFSYRDLKKYLIHIIADPAIILERRNSSRKEFEAYPTKISLEGIVKEVIDEEKYFKYFIRAFGPGCIVRTIDTSNISIESAANKILEIYNEM